MDHSTPLISLIAIGIGLAFVLALIAQRLRLPAIVGYLLAGIVIGPFTPGFVADQKLAMELAEVGVILLMFGVGLHFSPRDLLSVRQLALPGAIGQVGVATLLGLALAMFLGWPIMAGLIFGLALSVASTVVLLRALQERAMVETERGKIAVGWLIVEDILMVLALVLLPPLAAMLANAPGGNAGWSGPLGILALTLFKVALFAAIMLFAGRKIIPVVLHHVAHTGSRELFRLSVLAIALGVAFAAANLFGVSFALGAFFAGMVLSESQLSSQAAKETLPLRDAFAVLFFVAVGMLFNPAVIVESPFALFAATLIVVIGKSLAAYAIVRAFGRSSDIAFTISASLAQIGEFSFILAMLGLKLGVLPELGRDLIVGAAIFSILLNPVAFWLAGKMAKAESTAPAKAKDGGKDAVRRLCIVIGVGRVGLPLAVSLQKDGFQVVAADEDAERLEAASAASLQTATVRYGEADALETLPLADADLLICTIVEPFEAGHMVETARATSSNITIIARAETEEAAAYLRERGADQIVTPQEELAKGLAAAARQAKLRKT